MAKKEKTLSYLQVPLPDGRKYYKMTKKSWGGLNYRQTVDTGALSMERNISTLEAPYLVPSQKPAECLTSYAHPIGVFGFDDFLLVIYRDGASICVDYAVYKSGEYTVYTGVLQDGGATEEDEYPRCVVQFNVYDTPTDPISGTYKKKLLIFPDKKSMDFVITEDGFSVDSMSVLVKEYTNEEEPYLPPDTASHNYYYRNTHGSDVYRWVDDASDPENSGWKVSIPPAMPGIKYAAVQQSRLFGVDDDRVYVSGYNDYTNWNLDTVGEYNESNAWCSPAQSNTKAGGVFTGIVNYQGHVVCFKRDFMHEIYGTKNPFRIADIFAEGAVDHRTIQEVDGRLIFVSGDDVKVYTGSNPRIIGYCLGISEYKNAVSGTDGRCYYLYCEDENDKKRFFLYDTFTDYWSERETDSTVLGFAHTKSGMFMLCEDGTVYGLDTGEYGHAWSFETDLIISDTVNIKHVKKVQMLADVAKGASLKVYLLRDGEKFDADTSLLVYKSVGNGRKTVRVKLRQSAGYGIKLHFEGYGYVRLYELEMFFESGGTLYV